MEGLIEGEGDGPAVSIAVVGAGVGVAVTGAALIGANDVDGLNDGQKPQNLRSTSQEVRRTKKQRF